MTNHGDYLAQLDATTQEALVDLVREVADMTNEEKGQALYGLNYLAGTIAADYGDVHMPAARVMQKASLLTTALGATTTNGDDDGN